MFTHVEGASVIVPKVGVFEKVDMFTTVWAKTVQFDVPKGFGDGFHSCFHPHAIMCAASASSSEAIGRVGYFFLAVATMSAFVAR